MEPLAERVLRDEVDQRGQGLGVAAGGQAGVGQALVRGEDQLADPGGGRPCETVIEEVVQRLARPRASRAAS